jgi:hypothetical protein
MKKKNKEQVAAEYSYQTLDGKDLIQRRLVLAQMEQLIERLRDVKWPDFKNFNLLSFHEAIGPQLPVALSIILTLKGEDPRKKDIDGFAEELRFTLPVDEGIRAFKDFFLLNPTASIAGSLRDMIAAQAAMKEAAKTGSQTSS